MVLQATQSPILIENTVNDVLPDNVDASLLAHLIETLSLQSLKQEPEIWPHFGLVSPWDNGAHDDMSYATLLASADAICPYLSHCFSLGYYHDTSNDETPADLFLLLRQIGVNAESAMLSATQQVNTHKGAIFLLAILLGALGKTIAWHRSRKPSVTAWFKCASQLASPSIQQDFASVPLGLSQTYGEWAYVRHKIEGVRGVVMQEFNLVSQAFKYVTRCPSSQRSLAYSQMRLFFVAYSEDTNVLKRGGFNRYEKVRKDALHALHQGGVYTGKGRRKISELEQSMQQDALSSAAAGDMLIVLMLALKLYEKNLVTS